MANREELYKKLYHKLFREINETTEKLIKIQQEAEEMYLQYFDDEDEKKKAKKK